MFASVVNWTFKPETPEQKVRDGAKAIEATLNQIAGLQHYSLVRADDVTYITIILYDTKDHAEAGFATLGPVAQQQYGDTVLKIMRQSGEVVSVIDFAHGRHHGNEGPPPGSLALLGVGR